MKKNLLQSGFVWGWTSGVWKWQANQWRLSSFEILDPYAKVRWMKIMKMSSSMMKEMKMRTEKVSEVKYHLYDLILH